MLIFCCQQKLNEFLMELALSKKPSQPNTDFECKIEYPIAEE